MHLKDDLERLVEHLKELESHARKLPNQNFADIVKAGHSRVSQLTQHPDLDAVHEHVTKAEHDGGEGESEKPFPS